MTVNKSQSLYRISALVLCHAATLELTKSQSRGQAIKFLLRALTLEHSVALATSLIGFIWEFGLDGVGVDYSKAETFYEIALKQENQVSLLAASRLAFLKMYGRPGVSIDKTKAEEMKKYILLHGRDHKSTWIEYAAQCGLAPGKSLFSHD